MIIGNPEVFALESEQTDLFEGGPWLSNGTFFLHIAGRRFGSDNRGNTNMSIVLWEIERRLNDRGEHNLDHLGAMDAATLASIFEDVVYRMEPQQQYEFMSASELGDALYTAGINWSYGMGEAFDDGSRILQTDVGDQVCVVGYRVDHANELGYQPDSLREQWLSSDEFYGLLEEWRQAFLREYDALPKRPWPVDGMDPP